MKTIQTGAEFKLIKGPNKGQKIVITEVYVNYDSVTSDYITVISYTMGQKSGFSALKQFLNYIKCGTCRGEGNCPDCGQ